MRVSRPLVVLLLISRIGAVDIGVVGWLYGNPRVSSGRPSSMVFRSLSTLLVCYPKVLLITRFLQHEHHLGRSIKQVFGDAFAVLENELPQINVESNMPASAFSLLKKIIPSIDSNELAKRKKEPRISQATCLGRLDWALLLCRHCALLTQLVKKIRLLARGEMAALPIGWKCHNPRMRTWNRSTTCAARYLRSRKEQYSSIEVLHTTLDLEPGGAGSAMKEATPSADRRRSRCRSKHHQHQVGRQWCCGCRQGDSYEVVTEVR